MTFIQLGSNCFKIPFPVKVEEAKTDKYKHIFRFSILPHSDEYNILYTAFMHSNTMDSFYKYNQTETVNLIYHDYSYPIKQVSKFADVENPMNIFFVLATGEKESITEPSLKRIIKHAILEHLEKIGDEENAKDLSNA